jgi:hypothetical protein
MERVFRVFHHGIEAYQVHLCPGDEVIANGTDIAIKQPSEKSPFKTTAATAEAVRGVKLGTDTGVQVQTVDKAGRKTSDKPAKTRKTRKPAKRKAAAKKATKTTARKKIAAAKKTIARKTSAKKR